MANAPDGSTHDETVILAKIRPSSRLMAASSRTDLEPLYEASPTASFSLDGGPQWFKVRVEQGATGWDQAHTQVAGQLGIDGSDVIFAEPDMVHSIFPESDADGSMAHDRAGNMGVGEQCERIAQDPGHGKAVGDGFAWHLGQKYSQLGQARDMVEFAPPETRIAHIDTGYFPAHETTPANINHRMQRNFADGERSRRDASDPGEGGLVDNSGHGTGTLGILAGGGVSEADGAILGGAPGAEIVPIRVSSSVILIRTSALARALRHAADSGCAVATLSMGGLPTNAWAEAVDHAYLAGLTLCAAGGNRKGFSPPKKLVYPARYERVIAVTGAMADKTPYKDLKGAVLEGSFGPGSAMETAIAAYTPNIPWPKFGCPEITRMNGEGTSSATPQVAAAAALWIEKHKSMLQPDWTRVESVRHALFSSALKRNKKHFGNGLLRAVEALAVAPLTNPKQSGRSKHSWAFLRLATGIGVDETNPREEMFNLELAQLWLLDDDLQAAVPDPEGTAELDRDTLGEFMEAVIEGPSTSEALRSHLIDRYQIVMGSAPKLSRATRAAVPEVDVDDPQVQDPPFRRLQAYTKDPSLLARLDTASVGEVTLDVRWEQLKTSKYGFSGEYLEIDDRKRGSGGHLGVDLNDPRLLATDGWAPSEGNPQFHQQMVYGVAMKTIDHFERALGRPVQWRPRINPSNPSDDSNFVDKLVIKPHGLRTANAFYSPEQVALLFGHYAAPPGGLQIPGSPVYTCLSHDIIVHETTHAVLDGMYRRFNEPSNIDVLAFHEGFADIVALFQQFSMPDLLFNEIMRTSGDLDAETMLGKLASQLGQTRYGTGALRSAIGSTVDGAWQRSVPNPQDLVDITTPHARGAILVGAVFDAYLAIYRNRTSRPHAHRNQWHRGSPFEGAIHPDLARRLADEAAKSANHVLAMCVRALDFLPTVDVTFFDYLRALITADYEIESADQAQLPCCLRRGLRSSRHLPRTTRRADSHRAYAPCRQTHFVGRPSIRGTCQSNNERRSKIITQPSSPSSRTTTTTAATSPTARSSSLVLEASELR